MLKHYLFFLIFSLEQLNVKQPLREQHSAKELMKKSEVASKQESSKKGKIHQGSYLMKMEKTLE